MPPAIIGGAIAAVGAVGAAAIGSKASRNAVNAQTAAADQSAQVQREIYAQNRQALAPFQQSGLAANAQINALLGIGQPQQQSLPQQQPQQFQSAGEGGFGTDFQGFTGNGRFDAPFNLGGAGGRFADAFMPQQAPQTPPIAGQQVSPDDAFARYRDSTGYQFRLGEGMDALNSGYAGAGTLQSGAALKSAVRYGQDFASNEFGNYLGQLGNQQGLGFSAASAQAGVGQNFANSLGNINQGRANAISNGALINGQNTGQLINSLGQIGAGIFGQQQSNAGGSSSNFYNPRTSF